MFIARSARPLIKSPDGSNLRKGRFTLDSHFKGAVILKTGQAELEATAHTVSALRKRTEMSANA